MPENMGVLLDDAMTDLDKPVTVWLDGKKFFHEVPKRTLLTLARSARRRHDTALLFTARVP